MLRKFILATAVAAATSVCAQNTTEIPALSDMSGDFLVLNSQEYNGVTSLSSMKAFKMSPSDNTTVSMSGFYMARCLDFNAEYNEKNGSMSIASGTPIFDMESYMVYLCPWNSENEEVIKRPIEYRYAGNNTWQNDNDLMLVAILDENIQTSSFSNSSTIVRCNGTSANTSYAGAVGSQDEYNESRPCYVTINGNRIDIYNILQADQYGYGVHLSGTFDAETGNAMLDYTLTGYTNDGKYRILTGCDYDEATNMPTGMSYADTADMGRIHATIDVKNGTLTLDPMAIWVAEYDATTGNITVNENFLFEFVKTVSVTYDPASTIATSIESVDNTAAKEVQRVEYYSIDGRKIGEPQKGSLVIRVTVYKDNTSKKEKILFMGNR